jgi:hypothetical protein
VAKSATNANEFLVLPGQTHGYCIATSVIYVTGCNLVQPKVTQNSTFRRVAGVLHSQEMQRLTGCAGLLWEFSQLKAPMFGWTLYFTVKKDFTASAPSKFHLVVMCYFRRSSCVRFSR